VENDADEFELEISLFSKILVSQRILFSFSTVINRSAVASFYRLVKIAGGRSLCKSYMIEGCVPIGVDSI
jgi:hypothetical protein